MSMSFGVSDRNKAKPIKPQSAQMFDGFIFPHCHQVQYIHTQTHTHTHTLTHTHTHTHTPHTTTYHLFFVFSPPPPPPCWTNHDKNRRGKSFKLFFCWFEERLDSNSLSLSLSLSLSFSSLT